MCFPVLLLPVPVQLVGMPAFRPEDIGKALFHLHLAGASKRNLLSHSGGVLEQGGRLPCFGFRFVQFPPLTADVSPNCLRHKAESE